MERLTPGGLTAGFSSDYLSKYSAVINHITSKGAYAIIVSDSAEITLFGASLRLLPDARLALTVLPTGPRAWLSTPSI